MVIRLDENYNAMTSTALLGYVGETNARPLSRSRILPTGGR